MLKTITEAVRTKNTLDFFIYGFGQVLNLVSPFVVVPYIVHTCGVANFGKSGVAMAVAFFLIVIIDYGSDIISVKDVSVNRENTAQIKEIFRTIYAAKLLLLFLVMGFLSACYLFIPYFENEKTLYFLTFTIFVGQFLNPTWFLQGVDDFKLITLLYIVSKVFYLAGIFIFIQEPADYIYINFIWGLGMIIPFTAGFVICIRRYNIQFGELQFSAVSDFLKKHFRFFVSQLFLSMKNYSPMILISFLGGYFIAGQYKIIEQIIMPFRTYLQVIFRFFYPKLCFELSKNKKNGLNFWKKLTIANLFLVILLLTAGHCFSTTILHFFKVDTEQMLIMDPLLKYSLLLPLLLTISFIFEPLLLSLGKNNTYISVTIGTVLLNFTLIIVLFNQFGLYGLITALLITEAIVIISYAVILKWFSKITLHEVNQ